MDSEEEEMSCSSYGMTDESGIGEHDYSSEEDAAASGTLVVHGGRPDTGFGGEDYGFGGEDDAQAWEEDASGDDHPRGLVEYEPVSDGYDSRDDRSSAGPRKQFYSCNKI